MSKTGEECGGHAGCATHAGQFCPESFMRLFTK